MAATTPNTILLQVNGDEKPVYERQAAAATTPGDLIELASATTVTPVGSAGKVNSRAFALENPYASDPTALSLNQTYAIGDNVRYVYAQPGDLIYARLAASQTVAVGDVLAASATAGCLAKVTVDATTLAAAPVGVAEEAVTTTGSTGRIRVRSF